MFGIGRGRRFCSVVVNVPRVGDLATIMSVCEDGKPGNKNDGKLSQSFPRKEVG